MEQIELIQGTAGGVKSRWLKVLLVALVLEKIIQHTVVTLAFYFDWAAIGATVVVNPEILMVLGALVAILFAMALWGVIRGQNWAANLLIGLAIFDILGEFIAQGTFGITITVSFLAALALLLLAIAYRRQKRRQ